MRNLPTALRNRMAYANDSLESRPKTHPKNFGIGSSRLKNKISNMEGLFKLGSKAASYKFSRMLEKKQEHYNETDVKKLSALVKEKKHKTEEMKRKKKETKPEIPLYKKIQSTMSNSVKGGIANSLHNGLTTNYITPFAIANGAGSSVVTALGALPDFIGSLFQLFSITLIGWFKSRKKLILAAILLQTMLWIPLMLIPYIAHGNFFLLVLLITLNSTLTVFQNPIMDSLMGDIVPRENRGIFFGKRNRFVGLVSFVASFAAGLLLDFYSSKSAFFGFMIIFSAAAVAKLVSYYYKSGMYDPPYREKKEVQFTLADFIRKMKHTNFGRFVMFTFFFRIAVSIAAPFFALYMLRDLKMGYFVFMIVSVVSIISTFLSMSFWGKVIDSKGSRFTLLVSGFGIPFVPILWLANQNFVYLIFVEAFSGFCWAGFTLAVSSFMFDATTSEKRVRCISYYTLFWGTGIFIGSVLGGLIIKSGIAVFALSSIPLVFLISGVLRLIAVLCFLPKLKEVRLIEFPLRKGNRYFPYRITIRHREGFQMMGGTAQHATGKSALRK